MMKVFLDTNILLDITLRRQHFAEAVEVWQGGFEGNYEVCASALSFANAAYIMRKWPQFARNEVLLHLADNITILPLEDGQIKEGLARPAPDFEDTLQYLVAKAYGCDTIVTYNKRDFLGFGDMQILTSEEFLLSQKQQ